MKKTLLLALAFGLAGAAPLRADVNVYITGSTAFRANVYSACTRLFNTASNFGVIYGDAIHGGDGTTGSGNTSWAMIGTATNTLSFANSKLIVHALFTGSIQGIQSVENAQPLVFPNSGAIGTVVTAGSSYVTNSPTIAFSDTASAATPAFDVLNFGGAFGEEQVAVQPFVFCKSLAPGGAITNISNISWEQVRTAIPNGRIPYSAWTGKLADTNTYIYLLNRTADSGTRVTTISEVLYPYNQAVTIYNYDHAALAFYKANNSLFATTGTTGFGVIGSAPGVGNANLGWGPGYIGGGDLRSGLKYTDLANQSIGYLSLSDARTGGTNGNWGTVLSFNGTWPTAQGAAINNVTITNDFSPVTLGAYPFWTYEVVVYPTADPVNGGMTQAQLGDQNTPQSFLGVLDSQTLFNGGVPILGSLEYEIQTSKTNAPAFATAIRLSEMTAARGSVGGTIQVTPTP
jgi:hypothetical protein